MANTGKAYLTFGGSGGGKARAISYEIVVIDYTRGYNTQLSPAVVRNQKHNYVVRVKENDLQFTIQCRSVAEYDTLKARIRQSQKDSLVSVGVGFVRFSYPDLSMDYLGLITSAPEGVSRFLYAPTLAINMQLIRDTINTQTSQYSSLNGGSWQDIYGTTVADLNSDATPVWGYGATGGTGAGGTAEGVLKGNQPIPRPTNSPRPV